MELKFCEKSFMLTLTLPAKHGEGSKSKRVRAVFARSGTWLTLNQEQFKKLLARGDGSFDSDIPARRASKGLRAIPEMPDTHRSRAWIISTEQKGIRATRGTQVPRATLARRVMVEALA